MYSYKKTLLILCYVTFFTQMLMAQGQTSEMDSAYHYASEKLYILRNEMAIVPLQQLAKKRILHCSYGFNENSVLHRTLNKYLPTDYTSTHQYENIDTAAYNTTILSLRLDQIVVVDLFIRLYQESIIADPNTIVLAFGSPEDFRKTSFPLQHAKTLIYVDDRSKWSESLAAQLVFGGFSGGQKLTDELTDDFPAGSGERIGSATRLGYAPPEMVGMDAQLLQDSIGSIAEAAIAAGAFPGCQVLVAHQAKVVFHEVWGHHTYAQQQAVQLSDIYDFASVTKITSALPAIMRLHSQGQFELDAPLKAYFPKFKSSNKSDLAWRKILAHHARLKPWIPYWRSTIKKNGRFKWRTFKKRPSKRFPTYVAKDLYLHRKYKKRIYKAIRKSPLNAEGGYRYSGLAFYLLPEIVTNLTASDFETHLKSTFYQPLGAHTITYKPLRYFQRSRIIPTERDTFFRMTQIHGYVHDEGAAMMDGVSANAGLFGSANDLAKLAQMYLNGGTYGGERFIAEASLKEFTRCQYCDEDNRRGLGFDKPLIEYDPEKSSVARSASADSFGHSGYTGTFVWIDPQFDLIYIFFSNRVYPTRENRLIYELNVRPRIHQIIYDALEKTSNEKN